MTVVEDAGAELDAYDLRHETYEEPLELYGVETDRVDARRVDAPVITVPYAQIGRWYGWALDTDRFDVSCTDIIDELYMRSSRSDETVLQNVHAGSADFSRSEHGTAVVNASTFADGLTFADAEFEDTLQLTGVNAPYVDLRGATIPHLVVDDLDRYTFLLEDSFDGGTWIGEVKETNGDGVSLTENEQELYERILDRPRFPPQQSDGCAFAYDDLRRDFAMSYRPVQSLFGNLVKKGAIHRVDEDHYIARSDIR